MIQPVRLAQNAVVAVEGERRQPLVLHRLLRALGHLHLRLQAQQVLAPPIGQRLGLVERKLGKLRVGSLVGQRQLLIRGQADQPVQRNLVLGEGVLRVDDRLLLRLQLHPCAQHIEVRAHARIVRGRRLLQHYLVGLFQRLRILNLRGIGQRQQILRAHLQYHRCPRRSRSSSRRPYRPSAPRDKDSKPEG